MTWFIIVAALLGCCLCSPVKRQVHYGDYDSQRFNGGHYGGGQYDNSGQLYAGYGNDGRYGGRYSNGLHGYNGAPHVSAYQPSVHVGQAASAHYQQIPHTPSYGIHGDRYESFDQHTGGSGSGQQYQSGFGGTVVVINSKRRRQM